MGLFNKKQSISRKELKSALEKDQGIIPGAGGRKYYRREREKIAKEIFGTRYGSQISRDDYRRAIRGLRSSVKRAKTPAERKNINRKIKYLKRLGGERIF